MVRGASVVAGLPGEPAPVATAFGVAAIAGTAAGAVVGGMLGSVIADETFGATDGAWRRELQLPAPLKQAWARLLPLRWRS